jgi:hypothetical protein
VYAGKYYWEVSISGQCALVGVVIDSFDHRRYPGFDSSGWSFGDLGFGGEKFNDRGTMYGPSVTEEAVHTLGCLGFQTSKRYPWQKNWVSQVVCHSCFR